MTKITDNYIMPLTEMQDTLEHACHFAWNLSTKYFSYEDKIYRVESHEEFTEVDEMGAAIEIALEIQNGEE